MISKAKDNGVIRKPVPEHSTPQAHSPTGPALPIFGDESPVQAAASIFEQHRELSTSSQLHSVASVASILSRAPSHRSNTSTHPPEMSLQEYQRQHGRRQDLETELSTDAMPAELEGSQPPNTEPPPAPPFRPSGQYAQIYYQPGIPEPQLPQSYFVVDSTTGLAYSPTAQPMQRPISPPSAISTSYDFLGVPVVTSYNPQQRAKEVIVQRYAQEFRGMSSMGEALIRRLVDIDLDRERRRFEGLVWRGAGYDKLVGFAEWLMRGEE